MAVRIGTGLSTGMDVRSAAIEAGAAAGAGLRGASCDLAVVFASGAHLGSPEVTLDAVHEALAPGELIGCGAGGVIAGDQEVEDGTAISVWAAHLEDGGAEAFHASVEELEEGAGALTGMPDLGGAAAAFLLADPATFPTDAVLRFLSEQVPMVPLLGGLVSGRTSDGAVLFRGADVLYDGAVGVRLDGVEVLPLVSQGAAPIGPELTITAADGNIIDELAGRPALEKLRETIETLPAEDLRLVQGGLLMGIVVDSNKPEYVQGDFLVRGLVGADPATGKVAVAADVHPGQVVRLHARDAASADRDLREALSVRMAALGGRAPAGALVFSCNGRGREMFACPHHDAEAVAARAGRRPGRGVLRGGRDRAGRRRVLPARVHRDDRGVPVS